MASRRLLFLICALAALASGSLAAYLFVQAEDGPGATIEEPERELSVAIDNPKEISFRIRNPTKHEVSVVGYDWC